MNLFDLLKQRGRRRFKRYRQILSILAVHGFGEIVHKTGLGRVLRSFRTFFSGKQAQNKTLLDQDSTWVRIRMAIEELGPTFIKFGQILSNRPDLVPRELQKELEKLQEDVSPFSSREAAETVEKELKAGIDTLFQSFDPEPFAAASIAQLHRAVLPGGEEVAVKIQRPGLQDQVEIDVEIFRELAKLIVHHFPESAQVGPQEIVAEFERAMRQELDFRRESAAIERFAEQFAEDERIMIPEVYWKYSSRRVLTMEFVSGRPLADFLNHRERATGGPGSAPEESSAAGEQDADDIRAAGRRPFGLREGRRIAETGADLTLEQIFTHGFFHADPHPGNIFILNDGRLCYLDFGLTGNLLQRDLETISSVLISIIERNEQKAARSVIKLSGCRDYDTARSIERDIAELIDRFQSSRAGDFSFTGLLSDLVKVLVNKGLRLSPDLFLLVKSLITIEGVATGLDPEFDFAAHLEPFVKKLVRNRFDPDRIKKHISTTAADYADLLENIPADYYRVVDALSSGRVRLSVNDESLRPIRHTILQASSAIVFALVLSALIIGSAVIVHSRVPPLWNEIPVIGIIGFIAAGLMGFWLLIKIIRTGGF